MFRKNECVWISLQNNVHPKASYHINEQHQWSNKLLEGYIYMNLQGHSFVEGQNFNTLQHISSNR